MPATSVSAVENYIRAEKPSFSEIAREILLDQGEKERKKESERVRKREREREGKRGARRKRVEERIGGMTASASSRDRDEVKRMSNHITRGALPNPISLSPVALFSPACLCSSLLDPPASIFPERNAGIQPSLRYNRAPTSRPAVRSPSPSPVPFLPRSFRRSDGRIERSMGSVDYQSSATFGGQSWVTSVCLTGTTLQIFPR